MLEKHEGFYQLAHPKYKITSNGKMQLESKEDMKKRGSNSRISGRAGAFALTGDGGIEHWSYMAQFVTHSRSCAQGGTMSWFRTGRVAAFETRHRAAREEKIRELLGKKKDELGQKN